MKRRIRKIFKWLLFLLLVPLFAILLALITTLIPVNTGEQPGRDQTIYLTTNGVHLDIVLPRETVAPSLLADLANVDQTAYFSFGWGDRNFFLNTPTWGDLTFENGFTALFLPSESLMHLTRYPRKREAWTPVLVSKIELERLNTFLHNSFALDGLGRKSKLPGKGYSDFDDFYLGSGSYHCFNTCNTWANRVLKESGMKACWWTPFDFGLLWKYQD